MPSFRLSARKPFNFLSVVESHGWRQLAPFRVEDGNLQYVDRLPSGRVLAYRISKSEAGVTVSTAKTLSAAERREVSEKVRWMLNLEMDLSAFYAACRREPKLAQARKLARGRLLRSPSLFEDVIKTILTTNTLWAATRNMSARLVSVLGSASEEDPEERAFPTPAQIAASSPAEIQEKIRVGYRAPAIHELGVRVASGEFDLEALKNSPLSTLELRKEFMKINGVGPYAAANLLMILGRHDYIPIDSSALAVVSAEWYRGKPVSPQHVERRFKKWGSHKGLAFWFWDWKDNPS